MDIYEVRLSRSLREALTAKSVELTGLLATTPAPDHSSYMERVGRIRGIEQALTALADLEAKMSQPEGREDTGSTFNRRYED